MALFGGEMFSWFKKKNPTQGSGMPERHLPLPAELSDHDLIELLRKALSESPVDFASNVIIAIENQRVYYGVFVDSVQVEKSSGFAATLDGFAKWCATTYSRRQGDSADDKWAARRSFLLYFATALFILHIRARKSSELWDEVANLWLQILPGSTALLQTISAGTVWKPSELSWFDCVTTDTAAESYVESQLMPQEIRYHLKLEAWHNRGLPQDVIDEINRSSRKMFGD